MGEEAEADKGTVSQTVDATKSEAEESQARSRSLGGFRRVSEGSDTRRKRGGGKIASNVECRAMAVRLLTLMKENGYKMDYTKDMEEVKNIMDDILDETTKRFCEARVLVATCLSKKYLKLYGPAAKELAASEGISPDDKAKQILHHDDEITQNLVGREAFDGIVYDDNFKDPYRIEQAMKKGGDPQGRDYPDFGNTIPHCMAMCADLRWHTESWQIDRVNSMRKKGCDNRCAHDWQGRAPLLTGFEAHNVLFVKAMLRAEMGEVWTQKNLKRVPAYAPNGRLMKMLLGQQKVSTGRVGLGKSNQGFREELFQLILLGKAKAIFRLRSGGWFSALHWAAYNDDMSAIICLHLVGLPVNISNFIAMPDMSKVDMKPADRGGNQVGGGKKSTAVIVVPPSQEHGNTLQTPGTGPVRRPSVGSNASQQKDSGRTSETQRDPPKEQTYPFYETPLMVAVTHGCMRAITGLLKCKANPAQKNSIGETAMSLAQKGGNKEVIAALTTQCEFTEDDKEPFLAAIANGFDAVDAMAQLLDHGCVECPNIEDLCAWYCSFGPSSWERVYRFWKFYSLAVKNDFEPMGVDKVGSRTLLEQVEDMENVKAQLKTC